MDRLTKRTENGKTDIVALSKRMPELYAVLTITETSALKDVLNRLAEYEDTGLTPQEIRVRQTPVTIRPWGHVMVKAFDGTDKVVQYRCAPCPKCEKWIVVNPAHKFCEHCGQAVEFVEG